MNKVSKLKTFRGEGAISQNSINDVLTKAFTFAKNNNLEVLDVAALQDSDGFRLFLEVVDK